MNILKDILVPISPGELLDKITILKIKAKRIVNSEKVSNVLRELSMLEVIWKDAVQPSADISSEKRELEAVNESLWDTIESIHKCNAEGQSDEFFMTLAHRVCTDNDRRAEIKKRINKTLKSALIEEKSHQ